MRNGDIGRITGGPLEGARAVLVSRNLNGYVVKLLEPRGAYQPGDVVVVGTGEFTAPRPAAR
jgi:hypothetical protein